MDAKKVAKFIVNGYRENRNLINKILISGISIAVCKIVKVPVTFSRDGYFDIPSPSYTREDDDVIDQLLDISCDYSPDITAIRYILELNDDLWLDSDKINNAKKIFDIANNSSDSIVKSYAMKALNKIKDSMWSTLNKKNISDYILKLVVKGE